MRPKPVTASGDTQSRKRVEKVGCRRRKRQTGKRKVRVLHIEEWAIFPRQSNNSDRSYAGRCREFPKAVKDFAMGALPWRTNAWTLHRIQNSLFLSSATAAYAKRDLPLDSRKILIFRTKSWLELAVVRFERQNVLMNIFVSFKAHLWQFPWNPSTWITITPTEPW